MKKLLLVLLFFPLVSFGQKNTESELIMKINAVQQQVMAQGNITEEEERAILSLCSIMSKDDGLANYSPDDRIILKDVEIAPGQHEGNINLLSGSLIMGNGLLPVVSFCQSPYISYYENDKIKVAGESFEEIVGSKVSVKKI